MSEIRISPTVTIPEHELNWKFSRSGGPGGQNVNTRDTKAELIFDVAGSAVLDPHLRERALRRLEGKLDAEGRLHVVSSQERTQALNRQRAADRLGAILQEAVRPDPAPRRPTRPGRAARERRLATKKARSQTKRLRRSLPED